MTQEALKLALEALQFALHIGFDESSESQIIKGDKAGQQHRKAITALEEALAQTQEPVKCNLCDDSGAGSFGVHSMCICQYAKATPSMTEQEPVAHLWECIGRWSAYLVNNGTQAKRAPPSWLVDAINNATAPPQRTWVGLTDEDISEIVRGTHNTGSFVRAIEAKLKEKNT